MSRFAELAPWVPYAALLLGIALMIGGIMWRGAAPVEWGFMFGFASNSTPLGKVVYLVGALLLVFAANAFIFRGLKTRRETGCPKTTRAAKIVGWESSGLLRIKTKSKVALCAFSPTFDDDEAVEDAQKHIPAGTWICAAVRGKAAKRYQVAEGERVKVCTLYRSRFKLLSSAFKEARERAAASEDGDDDDGDDRGDSE